MTVDTGTRLLPGLIARAGDRLHRARLRAVPTALRGSWQEIALLGIALLAILGMRASAVSWVSGDYAIFLSQWIAYLQQNGFAGLGKEFADYNVPYLYLLYIGTLTPVPGLAWVKLLSSGADLAMALGAFAMLRHLRVSWFAAGTGSILVLLLPEVLLNSALWGQADSLWTALILWSLYFMMRRRATAGWVLFAIALAFKLQAVFLLPALALPLVLHRHRPRSLLIALAVFLSTYIPALIAGRSISSLLSIYTRQTGTYKELTMNAPSLYTWLPVSAYDQLKGPGTLFALAICAILVAILLRRYRGTGLDSASMLHIAAVSALLVPFVLPSMHERYFYCGAVLLFILALVQRRYLVLALVVQAVAVQAYTTFLFGMGQAVPFPLLTFVELIVILLLLLPIVGQGSPGRSITGPPHGPAPASPTIG